MRNLELEISSDADGGYRVAARSDAGDTAATPTTFPFDERELNRRLEAVEFALARSAATVRRVPPKEERPVQEFGGQLFEFLFPGDLREHLAAVRSQAVREEAMLQVRLRIRPPELAALPWEFLYEATRDEYLSLNTPLVRYLEVLEPIRPLMVAPPLRILGMVARPGELATLNVDHEKRRLAQALATLEHAGAVQLSWVAGQTWRDLEASLDQGGWHIFHFIGHGGFDKERGEGILALADQDGGVDRFAASDLGLLLGDHRSLRLVVLNACESARSSFGDIFSSTASVLTRRGIPAVVAMQYEISDEAAIAFARGLYRAVASRLPVDHAVTRARRDIKLTRRSTLEWATPVLYLRSPRAELFELATVPVPIQAIPEPQGPHGAGGEPDHVQVRLAQPESAAMDDKTSIRARTAEAPVGSLVARMDHSDRVAAIAFSPNGTQIATVSTDRTARLWDATTGKELTRMQHGYGAAGSVAFSPDGTRLATGSTDRKARLWDVATSKELAQMPHGGMVTTVAFSPDGTRIASASADRTARLWDATTGRELAQLLHGSVVGAVAFSPDGTQVATGCYDNTARLWDATTGRELAQLEHDDMVWAVAFSPDGTQIATASTDRTARLWDAATTRELAQLPHEASVVGVSYSPDGTRLATASLDNLARLWTA